MEFGFSFVGLLFLIMLFVPNIFWSRFKPKDYDKYSSEENKVLLVFERIGQILVVFFSLLTNIQFSFNIFLFVALILMCLYEIYWIKYFRSDRTMMDMYGRMGFIPLPGAVLPVFAFLILGIYADNLLLVISSIILGIGHIGIHIIHKNEIVM